MIEVISTNDQINKVNQKMRDYRLAGVQVVWHILPDSEEVHVFTVNGLKNMLVCRDEEYCSAAPVLPAFSMKVLEIFKI